MPPVKADSCVPSQAATTPDSNWPSCGPLLVKMLLIDDIRPRNSSGVLSWLIVERNMELMVSPAPVNIEHEKGKPENLRAREKDRREPVDPDAEKNPAAAVFHRTEESHGAGGEQRADGARGVEKAEAGGADKQNVARVNGKQAADVAEKRRAEIQQHERKNNAVRPDKLQSFAQAKSEKPFSNLRLPVFLFAEALGRRA